MDRKDLQSWNQAINFVSSVYDLTRHFPGGEPETLSQRIRKTAISLCVALNSVNIADNTGKTTNFPYLLMSLTSSLETYLLIAREHFLSRETMLLCQKLTMIKDMIEKIHTEQTENIPSNY